MFRGRIEFAGAVQRPSQVVADVDRLGIECQRFAQIILRFSELPLAGVDQTEVVVRFGLVWIEIERPAIHLLGFLRVTFLLERLAQQTMGFGGVGIQRDRLPKIHPGLRRRR